MFVSRVLARASRTLPRGTMLLAAPQNHHLPILSNQSQALIHDFSSKIVPRQVSLLHHSTPTSSISQIFGFSSSASPHPEKDHGSAVENGSASTNGEPEKASGEVKVADQAKESGYISDSQSTMSPSVKRRRGGTKRTAFSDSDSESDGDLTMDDLVKLVAEKEDLLKEKHEEFKKMQDKFLRSYAEIENVMERTKREAENSKKFAIQSFAKSLLDVADNLGRASSVVKESFSKLDESKDTGAAFPLLKTLLEGVEMTEKQLLEVFRKYGIEKYDPTNEAFDPNRHNAVFSLQDASKPPGTVAVVLKPGYMLHDRVVRPAEVGVTTEAENNADN
ncbi:grpE protein homolog 2, mitochondrial-like isoform X1 [Malus sylvestris]|uniref:grpE protein homolog 2, mitochondrial-like isoform X1 n=1 Tax=Malus sylvestris TaxID=3752 RepID=UPI0021ACE40A|nr:grpE protein homolog 2, mitochondrial-like isoform X1 [Malus sylvestris]